MIALLSVGSAAAIADPAVRTYKSVASEIVLPDGASRLAVEPGTGNILVLNQSSPITVRAPDGTTTVGNIAVPGTPMALATDPGTGAVYYAESSGTITRYVSDGAPVPTYTADGTFASPATGSGSGEIGSIADIAVDPSSRDLLVVDPTNDRVSRFSSAGAYISAFSGASAPSGGFAGANDIDVGPTGEILVLASGHVDRFSAAGVADGELTVPEPAAALAINPTTGSIAVLGGGGVLRTPNLYFYDDSAASPSVTPYPLSPPPPPVGSGLGAYAAPLAIDGSSFRAYGIYLDAIGGPPKLQVLDVAVRPGVDLSAPTQVDVSSMHLHGTVDAGENGTLPASIVEGDPAAGNGAKFVLTAPGLPTVETPLVAFAATTGLQPVAADATGLVPNTTYSVRLVAQNARLSNDSAVRTVTTGASAPAAVTGGVTDVNDAGAVLHGSVTAYGLQTTYVFEYGTTAAYGSRVPAGAPGVFGVSYTARAVQRAIEGLTAGVTYHYRLVATNAIGTTAGADATFTASAGDSPRGYELVTPADKGGGAIDTNFGFQAKADGDAAMWQPSSAFATVEGETSSVFHGKYLSRRDAPRWGRPRQVDPPVGTSRPNITAGDTTAAVSEDFSHAFVASNKKLTPDALPTELTGGVNLYVRDLITGKYTFVGGNNTDPSAFDQFTGIGQAVRYLGGADDFSSVLFQSPVPMTSDGIALTMGMYRWTSAGLTLISKLPDGSVTTGLQWRPARSLLTSVSSDGRRAAFVVNGTAHDGVYLFDDGHTRAISVSHRPGDPATVFPGTLGAVSRDGRYITFSVTSADPLTPDAPAEVNNIYRLDLAAGGEGRLELVAHGPNIGILDVSADGSHVYLGGQPTPSDPSGWHVWSAGTIKFVAGDAGGLTQHIVSPNGRYFAFSSLNKLTALDTASRMAVYWFDAVTGELECASCPQDGAPTTGDAQLSDTEVSASNRYPRAVIDDGRLFFHTTTRLVAGDVNDGADVYSFRDGRATLISSGKGAYTSRFMDASADGRDVFFASTERLSSLDQDDDFDFYDARVGGGDPTPETRARCGGDECTDPGATISAPQPGATQVATGHQVPGKKPAKGRITKVKSALTKTSIRVTVRVSAAGRIRASGSRVRSAIRQGTGAGTYTITVPLGAKARSALRHHRRLKVSIRVTFTPPFGAAATTTFSRTLGK